MGKLSGMLCRNIFRNGCLCTTRSSHMHIAACTVVAREHLTFATYYYKHRFSRDVKCLGSVSLETVHRMLLGIFVWELLRGSVLRTQTRVSGSAGKHLF